MRRSRDIRRGGGLLALLLIATSVAVARSGDEDPPPQQLAAYRGLAAWIDNFDWKRFPDPERPANATRVARDLRERGVKTLFMATSHHSQPDDVVEPAAVGRFLEAAHRHGIRVVAWYQPSLVDVARDRRRARAAIRFRSQAGERFDAFALDIEARKVRPVALRNRRVLELSSAVRRAAGLSYSLGAIVPSPERLRRHPRSWPGFPYRALTSYFDIFLPMAYWTYETNTHDGAYDYTRATISLLRKHARNDRLPIHAIGGAARHGTANGVRGYLRAARDCGVLGGGLYDFKTMSRAQWAVVAEEADDAFGRPPRC